MADSNNSKQKHRPSLTTMIVIAIVAGVLTGLFFGEYTRYIKWVGDAFVGLLQMAVLPYVAVSLVVNVGRLSIDQGLKLMRAAVSVMFLLWAVGIVTLLIVAQSFPEWETGSFFSSRFTEEPPAANWLDLFIPSNPFRSLAENAIPAVVVFCIGVGIAMIGLPGKEKLLEPLQVLSDSLATLNKLVIKLTPIGLFAIVAHTAGTLDFNEFRLIQGYLIVYGLAAIILAFVVLPALVSALTPLSYWDVCRASRDPLMAAFVIGNSFVVLPMVIEAVDRLQQKQAGQNDQASHDAQYLVPLAYPFPDVGRIVGLVFISFAAWFYGSSIDTDMIPAILGVGFLGSFGKPIITIPLLLNIAELPSDIFDLFIVSGVVAARFGDLMKTMHLIAFSLLTISILKGKFSVQPIKLLLGFAGSIVLLIVATLLVHNYLNRIFTEQYSREKLVTQREMLFPENTEVGDVETKVLTESAPNPQPIRNGQLRVQRIRDYGKIRIGFCSGRMPFAYYREDGKLIGFDVQMAYYLAFDLEVGIEFVPIDLGNLDAQLHQDHFDIAMSALEGTVQQAELIPATDAYMEVTLALVVPDHDKRKFRDAEKILEMEDLKFAVIRGSYFAERARTLLRGQFEVIEIDSAAEYFNGLHEQVHGLVTSAESGSAWTLRYPGFTVANPLKGRVQVPLYYLTADDKEFEQFLQNWLTLKKSAGTFEALYDYWILGLDKEAKPARWSILRNVPGWVK